MSVAYLGLGSNLDAPIEQLKQALLAIQQLRQTHIERVSSFYETEPWGLTDQPNFINAVACIHTKLCAWSLLRALQVIENQQQRRRELKWGPRTLDLDILLFDQLELNLPELVIPHRLMLERAFVVYPLYEIAPDLVLPSGEALHVVKAKLPASGIKIMSVR